MFGMRRPASVWAIAAGSLVLGMVAPAGAAAAGAGDMSCQVSELPLPAPARESAVTAGDPSGRWLGGYRLDGPDGEAVYEALLWHEGALVAFDLDLDLADIAGVNRRGVVAGNGYDDSGRSVPYALVDGATVLLIEPDDALHTFVTGVSTDGTVVADGHTSDGRPFAVTWSVDQPGVVSALRLPPRARDVDSAGISPHGRVAVTVTMPDGRSRVFLFNRNGKRSELDGLSAGASLVAESVANGWVVAREREDRFGQVIDYLRFDLRNDTVDAVPFGGIVNKHGTIAGPVGEDAALFTDEIVQLPGLADVPNGASAATLDNAGQPAGQAGASAADASTAIRWYCD